MTSKAPGVRALKTARHVVSAGRIPVDRTTDIAKVFGCGARERPPERLR
ncbi:hypothetical protein [Streptomyces decoyicus]|nr:hypothetical protein OG532_35930 [Streptomyces decoyicus]